MKNAEGYFRGKRGVSVSVPTANPRAGAASKVKMADFKHHLKGLEDKMHDAPYSSEKQENYRPSKGGPGRHRA